MTLTAVRPALADFGQPQMRGRLHVYAFFAAVVGGTVMAGLAAARPGTAPLVSTSIYGVTVCALFGVSALYHRRVWTPRGYRIMRRLDHAMIYIFIAGTYTPLCVLLLSPAEATVLLATVWTGALAGAVIATRWPHAPRWVSAPLYLILGWAAVPVLPDFLHAGGAATLILLAVGGIGYSTGAVLFALRRPNPWPDVFGHHEFFHACTVIAAACHHAAIYVALFA
ncbi:PAQR family membrane homeostasis protein TrhA [Catellatospora sichuanensis]|uniref:PAQR family membrane homeostasis protein TrhA n=1 Tax=Catellatospora sichuanensis TaxID=1969805 RepID=UPI001181E95F|nr:hemolysin III family protein [Catellatospora sichuanensis]